MIRLFAYLLTCLCLLPVDGFSQNRQSPLTIGLLLPDQSHIHIIAAAELAIDEANRNGGYGNQDFRLVVRTAEGFWGAGSKESVSLVYEDQVRAIIGSLDGRNGHLAEQVATKSHLSYIETYATEATLSQAFVPWFMRVVPNDDQQARVIVEEIRKAGGGKVLVLSNGTYDCKYAIRSLTKAMAMELKSAPELLSLEASGSDADFITREILTQDPDHLIIAFDAPYLKELSGKLRNEKPGQRIYGTQHVTLGIERRKEPWETYEGMLLIRPLLTKTAHELLSGSHAAYVYDAINLVIEAIRQVGTRREDITDHISRSEYLAGASGSISFDEFGNRKDAARLYQIKNGMPQLLNQD